MFLFIRFIPVLLPLLVSSNFLLNYLYPKAFWYFFAINIIIAFFATMILVQKSYTEHKKEKNFSFLLLHGILPVLLVLSTHSFITSINSIITVSLITFGMFILLFMHLESNFLYLYYPAKYQLHSRENISEYIAITIVFLTLCSFFQLIIFINMKVWILLIIICILIFGLQYYLFWLQKINHPMILISSLISSLIMGELFFTMNLLPTSIYVSGISLTLIYYIINKFNFAFFNNNLHKKFILRQTIFVSVLLIILLVSARWT